MFSNLSNSIKDNFIQRTSNPFLGTLFLVWIIRNWKFVYSLFYFDSSCLLSCRLEIISCYFQDYSFWQFAGTVLISFIVLIITYALINLSRLIINFFDKIVTPWVYKITDKSSVVLKEDFLNEIKKNELLESRYNEERAKRQASEKEVESLELKITELISPKSKNQKEINMERNESSDKDNGSLFEESIQHVAITNNIFEKLKEAGQIHSLKKYIQKILNEDPLDNHDESVEKFLFMDIIKRGSSSGNSNQNYYVLTPLGDDIRRLIIEHYD